MVDKRLLEKRLYKLRDKIKIVAKKLSLFTFNDVAQLVENNKVDLTTVLEYLVKKGLLKFEDNIYKYVPQEFKKPKKEKKETGEEIPVQKLPFKVKKPKEIYLRHINQLPGYVDYFFATKKTKERIKRILKLLKEAHGLKDEKLEKVLKKYNVTQKTYNKYRCKLGRLGLLAFISPYDLQHEPREIYYFFKEYYLSPNQYTIAEARGLAIQRFQKLIGREIFSTCIAPTNVLYKELLKEYSMDEIEKFRYYNCSEMDTEKYYKE